MDSLLEIAMRIDEINEMIRLAYREKRLDVVDDLILELHELSIHMDFFKIDKTKKLLQ